MSTEYNVVTRYTVDRSVAQREMVALGGTARELGASLRQSVFSVRNLITGGAISAGIVQLSRGLIGLNSSLEQSEVSIATLLNVNNVFSFNDALTASHTILGQLRDDASRGVGELSDYLGVYQQIISPSRQASASLDQVRELTRLMVAAGTALRGKQGAVLGGFDVQQALTAGAGERTTPIVNQALRAQGMTLEAFNRMSSPQRFQTLLTALQAFSPAIDRQARSWEGVSSTTRDLVKNVFARATQPLFARWTADLIKVNDWLHRHKEQIDHIVTLVGDRLVAGWDRTVSAVRNWRGELLRAIPVLTTLMALNVGSRPGGVQSMMALGGFSGRVIGRVGNAVLGPAAREASAAASDLAFNLGPGKRGMTSLFSPVKAWQAEKAIAARVAPASALSGLDNFGSAFAGGVKGGAFGGIGGIFTTMLGGVKPLMGVLEPFAAILGKLALPIAIVTSMVSAFVADTLGAATFVKGQVSGLWEEAKVTFGALIGIFDNGITRTVGAALLGLGGVLIGGLKYLLRGLNAVLVPISTGFQAIGILIERGAEFVKNVFKTRSFSQASDTFWGDVARDMASLQLKQASRFKLGSGEDEKKPAEAAPKPNAPRTQVNIGKVQVIQRVEQDGSPDRVAFAWSDFLEKVQRYPRQSRTTTFPVS